MKTLAILCLILAGAIFVMGAAAATDKDQPAASGKKVAGCRLSLRANKNKYLSGEAIDLRLTLENDGDNPVVMNRRNLMQDYAFNILLPGGKASPLTL